MTMACYGKDPQWMRSMQERYQRLHAKVADQAVRQSLSKKSVAVRLRELRQRKYPNRPAIDQDVTANNQNNSSPKNKNLLRNKEHPTTEGPLNEHRKDTRQKRPQTQLGGVSQHFLENPDIVPEKDKAIPPPRSASALPSLGISPDLENREDTANARANDLTDECTNTSENLNLNENADNSEEDFNNNFIETGDATTGNGDKDTQKENIEDNHIACSSKLSEKTKTPLRFSDYKKMKLRSTAYTSPLDNREKYNIPEKSEFKTSKYIQRRCHSSKSMARQTGATAAERRSLYARMSLEAQHAIDETMKEMTLTEQTQRNWRKESIPAEANASGTDPTKDVTKHAPDISDLKGENIQDNVISGVDNAFTSSSSDSKASEGDKERIKTTDKCCSKMNRLRKSKSADPFENRKKFSIPPKTQERFKVYNQNPLLPHPQPLPAIRHMKDWTFRDDNFNITSPNFDIRFCETSLNTAEDNEPSCEEIRKQSIEKCRLWLEHQLK